MNKKIGVLTLSGLIIGPVLGSGIVVLPPLAYELLGPYALYAWGIIMALGAVFAYVFIQLSILSPGNEGVSIAIGKGLGPIFQEMASNFIVSAVCFGPVVVLLTAAEYIKGISSIWALPLSGVTWVLLFLCLSLLSLGVQFIGKITLFLSTFIGLLIIVGSSYTLITTEHFQPTTPFPSPSTFGQTLLLLFWAIVGWEIVGNYVDDVKDPQKTLNRSMVVSLLAISSIYLLSAFAFHVTIQQQGNKAITNMSIILTPLFGNTAPILLGIAASGLCLCTYLMVVGGISRLIAAKTKSPWLKTQNRFKTPIATLLLMGLIHSFVLLATFFHMLDLKLLVAIASAFFIGNAVLGLMAGFVLLKNPFVKVPIVILIVSFLIMLLFSTPFVLILFCTVSLFSFWKVKHNRSLKQPYAICDKNRALR